jgi:hypothetical protein
MPDQDINIRLKLLDQYSAQMEKFQNSLRSVAQTGIEAGRQMKMVGREISQLGQTMAWTGTAMAAPLLAAFKSAENYSIPVSRELEKMNNAFIGLRVSVAESLLPTMKKFTEVMAGLLYTWQDLSPKTRELITSTILLTGVFIALGGTVVALIGRFIRFGGVLLSVTSQFAAWAVLNPVLLTIGVAIGALIFLMIRFKDVGDRVINALESGFKILSIGFWTIIKGITDGLDWVYKYVEIVYEKLAKLPAWLGGNLFKGASVQVKAIRDELQETSKSITMIIDGLASDVQRISVTGKGDWAKAFDDMKAKIVGMFEAFTANSKKIIPEMRQSFDAIKAMGTGLTQNLRTSFKSFFEDFFHGQLKKGKDYFVEFGNSILSTFADVISQMITEWLVLQSIKGLGSLFGGVGGGGASAASSAGAGAGAVGGSMSTIAGAYHTGGIIRAHSGLAVDEVPIIAQSGEGIISRRGMASLGRDNFDRINRGEGTPRGGDVYQPILVIQAWDAQDVMRNSKMIEAIISNALTRNTALRGQVKKYG